MRGLAWFLAACLCWCAAATPCFAAERQIAHYQGLTASVDSGFGCARSASITVRAPEASAYTGDRIALQRLLGTARAGLGVDCPILREIDIAGYAAGTPAFQASIDAENGWRLPAGTGHLETARFVSPLARETARCDYDRDNPFVGCWVTVAPETAGGTILNIKNDATWYWDTPEKLARGETEVVGTEVKHDYMYLAGPYLTFIQKSGLAANMIGPYFGWDCDVLKINPYDPGGLATLMGMSYGITEPNIFVRLHSPQWINANILQTTDDSLEDGFTGNAEDDEIIESLPDDGPLFNNCVDNFDQDITDEIMLDIALLAIPPFRFPFIVSTRYSAWILSERLFRIAERNPFKYASVLKAFRAAKHARLAARDRDIARALTEIRSGTPRPNVRSPKKFENDGRGGTAQLRTHDKSGNNIVYTEHTVNPRPPGGGLDGKRIIIGTDGRVYATLDHFINMSRIK